MTVDVKAKRDRNNFINLILSKISLDQELSDKRYSLLDKLETPVIETETNIEEDYENERFESIISFPNFLLIVKLIRFHSQFTQITFRILYANRIGEPFQNLFIYLYRFCIIAVFLIRSGKEIQCINIACIIIGSTFKAFNCR